MINCIIVDDEAYSIEILTEYISKAKTLKLVGTFTNPLEALKFITNGEKPDLIFLDIDMPELYGFEFAGLIPPEIAIIYVTAYSDYAFKSFETNVYDFLLKPVSFVKFLQSINRITSRFELPYKNAPGPSEFFFINPGVKGKVIKVAFADVIYIEGLKNYVTIYVDEGKFITYLTMGEIENALPSNRFIRIHKSYIVNLNKIRAVEGNVVIVSDKLSLPLGNNYKDSLMFFINKYSIISKRKD